MGNELDPHAGTPGPHGTPLRTPTGEGPAPGTWARAIGLIWGVIGAVALVSLWTADGWDDLSEAGQVINLALVSTPLAVGCILLALAALIDVVDRKP